MYAKIENGSVTQVGLPSVGTVNGVVISNYNLLPEAILIAEGWLPYTEDIAAYDEATQIPQFDHYEILVDGVVGHYTIAPKPLTLKEQFDLLDEAFLNFCVNLPMLIGV